ncbi:MAG: 4-hydroxy-tetrahydrodipicolinate synthase [Verrucomicrobiota bacterium]
MSTARYTGSITAIATPFDENGALAVSDLEKLVESQIAAGINGILPVGTTGESPTLNHDEHNQVVDIVVDKAKGRVPIIAGAGSNSTREAEFLTKHAHDSGADAILHVTGYYNKPSQEGIFQHFSRIAELTDKTIILYSIPGRCMVDISVETVERLLAKYPHVNHIKEAGGSVERVDDLKQAMGDDIVVLSGDDSLTLPFISVGAEGVISVASNALPAEVVAMVDAALAGNLKEARRLHQAMYPIFKALFVEPNPVPVKACLQQLGIFSTDRVRMPLWEMPEETKTMVLDTFAKAQVSTQALATA